MKNLFNRKSKCNIMQIDINTLNKLSTMRLKGLKYRDIENLTGISFGSVYGFISRNTRVRYIESLKYKGYITLRNYSLKYNINYRLKLVHFDILCHTLQALVAVTAI